jgi:hypothetical protein
LCGNYFGTLCYEISEYDGCNFVILYIENLQFDLGSRLKYC